MKNARRADLECHRWRPFADARSARRIALAIAIGGTSSGPVGAGTDVTAAALPPQRHGRRDGPRDGTP